MSPSVTAGSLNNGGIFNMYIDGDGENNIHQTPPTNNTCFELNSPVRFEV
jgi:hypothetical protein